MRPTVSDEGLRRFGEAYVRLLAEARGRCTERAGGAALPGGAREVSNGPVVKIKRVYEPRAPDDGERILVDRLWPRGLSRRAAAVDRWMRDLAPSDALRKWFGHDPARWPEFRRRYVAELRAHRDAVAAIARMARARTVTLLFGARDRAHNNAVVLKGVIDRQPGGRRRTGRRAA